MFFFIIFNFWFICNFWIVKGRVSGPGPGPTKSKILYICPNHVIWFFNSSNPKIWSRVSTSPTDLLFWESWSFRCSSESFINFIYLLFKTLQIVAISSNPRCFLCENPPLVYGSVLEKSWNLFWVIFCFLLFLIVNSVVFLLGFNVLVIKLEHACMIMWKFSTLVKHGVSWMEFEVGIGFPDLFCSSWIYTWSFALWIGYFLDFLDVLEWSVKFLILLSGIVLQRNQIEEFRLKT